MTPGNEPTGGEARHVSNTQPARERRATRPEELLSTMRIDIITIFPDYFAPLELSLIGKARAAGILDIRVHDLRSWTYDRHKTVDDTPYGGGPGMVMKPEPWGERSTPSRRRRRRPRRRPCLPPRPGRD